MILLLIFILMLALLLSAPIKYCIIGQKQEMSYGKIKVSWLWGSIKAVYIYDSQTGFNRDIKLLGKSTSFSRRKENADASKKKRFAFEYLMDTALLKKIIHFLKEAVKHIKPQTFVVDGKIGLDNPYATAIAIGIISMINLPSVNIQPIFDEEIIEGHLKIQGKMIIGMLLMLFIKFLIAKPVRNIVIKLIKNKGEKSYVH